MVAVSADNLASQAIGGFIGLHSAIRKCRFCMATNEDINSKVKLLYTIKVMLQITYIRIIIIKINCMHACLNISQFAVEELQLRTMESHTRHCNALGGALDGHFATTYGVARNSILNTLQNLNVINGLPPNIMHDVMEGVLPLEVKLMLNQFINEDKLFTLER